MDTGSRAPDSAVFAQWIAEARAGNQEALGKILEHCRPYLLLIANQQMGDPLRPKFGASDLVQETFLKAHGNFAGFHGATEGELLAWLRQILHNQLVNTIRQFQGTDKRDLGREITINDSAFATVADGVAATNETPSKQAVNNEQTEALYAALAQLSKDYQQVIQLRSYDRLPFEEVGKQMGRTAEAVRRLWRRAIEALQQILDKHESK